MDYNSSLAMNTPLKSKPGNSLSIRKLFVPTLVFLMLIVLYAWMPSNYYFTEGRQGLSLEIVRRLRQASANWARSNAKRDAFEDDPCFLNNIGVCRPMALWDYFSPSFDCPYNTERIGKVADGGKWVCGIEVITSKPSCLVYSFGISGDSSFEEEILDRTNCIVRMYDPTPNVATELTRRFPGRAFFASAGLNGQNVGNYRTLKSLMERNGDRFLDILKMDVEGAEFFALMAAMYDFPELPFGQLQVEFHINRPNMTDGEKYKDLKLFWSHLEEAGLRPFRNEPNLAVPEWFYEYAFVNIKADLFKIPETLETTFQ